MDHFVKLGNHYGYPQCCIEHFCHVDWPIIGYTGVFMGTGFIPCPACRNKKPSALIQEINAKRKNKIDFYPCANPTVMDDADEICKKSGDYLYRCTVQYVARFSNIFREFDNYVPGTFESRLLIAMAKHKSILKHLDFNQRHSTKFKNVVPWNDVFKMGAVK